uniref:Uncharacterized protein n=1 Tax=Arundo donax TaxID=35708 RepID=A0A0A9AJ28_ARUDO
MTSICSSVFVSVQFPVPKIYSIIRQKLKFCMTNRTAKLFKTSAYINYRNINENY